jgi:hypothetical protein
MTRNIGSHWDTCWKDSSEHWECAVVRMERLEAIITEQTRKLVEVGELHLADESTIRHLEAMRRKP